MDILTSQHNSLQHSDDTQGQTVAEDHVFNRLTSFSFFPKSIANFSFPSTTWRNVPTSLKITGDEVFKSKFMSGNRKSTTPSLTSLTLLALGIDKFLERKIKQ